jgi:hypothetical protein
MYLQSSRILVLVLMVVAMAASPVFGQTAPLIKERPVDPKAAPVGSGTVSAIPPAAGASAVRPLVVQVGWNRIHAYTCFQSRSGSAYTVQMISAPNEGVTLTTTIPLFQNFMIAQCATGNLTSFYVTRKVGNTFTWSNIQSWSVK